MKAGAAIALAALAAAPVLAAPAGPGWTAHPENPFGGGHPTLARVVAGSTITLERGPGTVVQVTLTKGEMECVSTENVGEPGKAVTLPQLHEALARRIDDFARLCSVNAAPLKQAAGDGLDAAWSRFNANPRNPSAASRH